MKFIRLFPFLVLSPRVQEGKGQENTIVTAVEAVPVGSKPPAAVGVRISTGERHGFGASAPFSTRALSKLVKLVEPFSTLTEKLLPFII